MCNVEILVSSPDLSHLSPVGGLTLSIYIALLEKRHLRERKWW